MSDENRRVPFPPSAQSRPFLPTLESLEARLSIEGEPEFKLFPHHHEKRAQFKKEFESKEAVEARTKDQRKFYRGSWELAERIQSIVHTASLTKETCRELPSPSCYLGMTEKIILEARAELGGIIAELISEGRFNEIKNLIKSLENEAENRKASPLRYILSLIEPSDCETLNAPDLFKKNLKKNEHKADQSNFNKELKKFGLGSLLEAQIAR